MHGLSGSTVALMHTKPGWPAEICYTNSTQISGGKLARCHTPMHKPPQPTRPDTYISAAGTTVVATRTAGTLTQGQLSQGPGSPFPALDNAASSTSG